MNIDYKLGFELAKANFEKLHKASKLLYFADNFGVACSLNILACEELIKSFVLHLNMLYPNIKFENSEEMFKNHKVKHKELKGFIESTHNGTTIFKFDILEDKEQFMSILPKDKIEEYQKEYEDIERVRDRTETIRKFNISIDEIFEWLDKANIEKNLGLYVGLTKHNNWESPEIFTKERYDKEKQFTKLLKLHFENAIDITTFMKELRSRGISNEE